MRVYYQEKTNLSSNKEKYLNLHRLELWVQLFLIGRWPEAVPCELLTAVPTILPAVHS